MVVEWENTVPPHPKKVLYTTTPAVTWVGPKPAESGLVNVGNTCYVNATLQALVHLPGFVEFLQNDKSHRSRCYSLLDCVECALYRTYLNMSLHPIFKPLGLVNLLPRIHKTFRKGKQADAQEFLTFLLSSVQDSLVARCKTELDFCSKQTTAMGKIFGWWTESHASCIDCEATKVTYNPLSIIALPLTVERGHDTAVFRCIESVQDAVNHYMDEVETVVVKCTPKCASQKASKSVSFHSYPSVLTIMFNRFDNDGRKITLPVKIDKTLNVGKAVYKFASGIIHEGPLLMEGHYTCLAVRHDGKLMHYNDSVPLDGTTDRESNINSVLHHRGTTSPKSTILSMEDVGSEDTATAIVTPVKIPIVLQRDKNSPILAQRRRSLVFNSTAHANSLNPSTTVLKKNITTSLLPSTQDGGLSPSTSSEMTMNAPITPLKITRYPRTEPKSSASQSSHEYVLHKDLDEVFSQSSPNVPIAPIRMSDSQSINEYVIHPTPPSEKKEKSKESPTVDNSVENSVTLTPKDVPGGLLPKKKLQKNRVSQLERWLLVRGITKDKKDKKVDLIKKVEDCIKKGLENTIDPTVDNGRWYTAKQQKLRKPLPEADPDLLNKIIEGLEPPSEKINPVTLTADDVPGGHLPHKNISQNTLPHLRRWLELRNIPHVGVKKDLVQRY
ncbi:ubiquitin carboxyl-terminal hydrolase 36-like [Thrips palmi]|uniref:Ubiquitin carboxyl-terminal hydrolase 36 n=1 Tax=Thrips palmi TaxID=161013 RepID=A0A6P8YP74_THRPL|nr:ubiquitin carboxyl-terminal hydrolase 36-like [Thrips palmi]